MKHVHAYTAIEYTAGHVPAFVNLSQHEDASKGWRLTVRGDSSNTAMALNVAHIDLSREQLAELAKAATQTLIDSMPDCPHAAPHRFCDVCPVSPCPCGLTPKDA